eukprot:evm.model.NODE_34354_length_1080_cov_14.131481.1
MGVERKEGMETDDGTGAGVSGKWKVEGGREAGRQGGRKAGREKRYSDWA